MMEINWAHSLVLISSLSPLRRMSEKLCLKWNDFHNNIKTAFESLRGEKNFTDVTLACEDGKQFEAHKVVMASSSPFFQCLLKTNRHTHPLIYMRGVKSEDLQAILDFLYCGEANVFQDSLDSFLSIAEELQLKGLMRSSNDKVIENETKAMIYETRPEDSHKFKGKQVLQKKTDEEGQNQPDMTVAKAENISEDLLAVEEKVQSMLERNENRVFGTRAAACKVCGKEGKYQNIKRHIEANQLEAVFSFPCNLCGKISRSRNAQPQST